LVPLLEHCLEQLREKSELSFSLLQALAACSEEGMEILYFVNWQSQEKQDEELEELDQEVIEDALAVARDFGLLLVEEEQLRLHSDLLEVLRIQDLQA
jgi:hypothetical protein